MSDLSDLAWTSPIAPRITVCFNLIIPHVLADVLAVVVAGVLPGVLPGVMNYGLHRALRYVLFFNGFILHLLTSKLESLMISTMTIVV